MNKYNFVRIGSAVPVIDVANCKFNIDNIYELIKEAENRNVSLLAFPELCVTGYTCGDLFYQNTLIEECERLIKTLLEKTQNIDMLIVIGAPVKAKYALYNCAIVINKGKILGMVPKTYLPNYGEFYEKRWFNTVLKDDQIEITYCNQDIVISANTLFQHQIYSDLCIGIEICEDLWSMCPPSTFHAANGATVIFNLSASNDFVAKSEYRKKIAELQSSKCMAAYIYTSAGYGESTTDLVFSGQSMIFEDGRLLNENEKYRMENQLICSDIDIEKIVADRLKSNTFFDCSKKLKDILNNRYEIRYFHTESRQCDLQRYVDPAPFIPSGNNLISERCKEIFNIQIMGLIKRIKHINAKSIVLGVSGGLDSTLALLVCAKTCDKLGIGRSFIKAITMPGFGTTDRTYNNAVEMIKRIGADFREISIKNAVIQHFKDINHDISNTNVVYENSQARERTQILMDVANQENGIVVGTGDLSELALGWATYNGDQMSMYGVNSSIPKTLIRYIINWVADNEFENSIKSILMDVLDTPVSPELIPPDINGNIAQKTEDLVGPYELHDFFIYNVLRFGYRPSKVFYLACYAFEGKYDKKTILKWIKNFYKRFFSQQYKRTCMPDGAKVGSICLSPRGDLRMPTDASSKLWLEEVENITL